MNHFTLKTEQGTEAIEYFFGVQGLMNKQLTF